MLGTNSMTVLVCVSSVRRSIRHNGMLLPQLSNAPSLLYVIKGRGIIATMVPGYPESFQSFQQQSEQSHERRGEQEEEQRREDSFQQVHRINEGDIIALPAEAAHWRRNDAYS